MWVVTITPARNTPLIDEFMSIECLIERVVSFAVNNAEALASGDMALVVEKVEKQPLFCLDEGRLLDKD